MKKHTILKSGIGKIYKPTDYSIIKSEESRRKLEELENRTITSKDEHSQTIRETAKTWRKIRKEQGCSRIQQPRIRVIQITARHCSPKVQPDIEVGAKFVVDGTDHLKDGTEVLLLVDWEKSNCGKVKTIRCNAHRFSWQPYTDEMAREDQLKQEAEKSYNELLHSFTFEEHMQIAFVPHIIIYCAWKYTEKVLELAARDRISEVKKLSRTVRMLREEYDNEIAKDLDRRHTAQIDEQAQKFLDEFARDFTIMEMTLRGEILKAAPDDPYLDMRVAAFAGMLMCDYYARQTAECDQMIARKLGNDRPTVLNPKITALRDCLDAYTGTIQIDLEHNVELCVRIFANNLKRVDFRLEHEKRIATA